MCQKVLVTGGAGFVGSVLVPELLNRGYKVRVLDNLMYNQSSLLQCCSNRNFEFIKGDIRDSDTLKKSLRDVDCIIHLAAIVGAPACRKDPWLAKEVNYMGMVLLDRCRSKSQFLIYSSTGSNYGAVNGICTEETPLSPLSEYGFTKTKAEEYIMNSGNAVALRFATGFGLSPRLRLDLLPNDFTFRAVKNSSLIVYERDFRRTFIHVRDMARAFIFALENYEDMLEEVYNVGTESMNYTKEEIARVIRSKVDFYLYFADIGSDPDKRNYEVSYEKIRAKGFETTVSMEEGIEELIRGIGMIFLKNPYSNIEE